MSVRLQASLPVEALQGETLDALVFRVLKKGPGAVEPVLAANPNLADLGLFLPAGTPVRLPVAASGPVDIPQVQLWS
ncbi:MAG: phage tail protein [Caulobacteraceae bacterium]|nr:MAG: phage tail protein [Caulobacteraceae bacterium]